MLRASVLENKTKVTFHRNIGSLKTAIEEEWNRISEECILKTDKSFRRRVDTIVKMAVILSKFTLLNKSSNFVAYYFKLRLNLFYNRVVYYYTRI